MSLDIYLTRVMSQQVYEANITHNLGKVAVAVGLYQALWDPEEIGVRKAGDLIPYLTLGLTKLRHNPGKYMLLEPFNKWGTVLEFIPWLEKLKEACEKDPDALVEVRV